MINLQEIRVGNQVFHNTSGATVMILQVDNDKIMLDTFPQSHYYSHTDLSGIPLTTDMLQKLSFTNDEDVTKWSGYGLHLYSKPDGFFYGLRILKSRSKIQYLHQLQNYVTDFYAVFKQQNRTLSLNGLH